MTDSFPIWVHAVGWFGGGLVVVAYLLNTTGKLTATHISYQLLNLTGSIALIVNTAIVGAYPSTAVNIIWVFIAVLGLWKGVKEKFL